MSDSRNRGDHGDLPIRGGAVGGRVAPSGGVASRGRADLATGHRQRIPTLRQLAGLLVNGILTLPRNYRRGMFLDVIV